MKSNTLKRTVTAVFIILFTLPTFIPDTPILTVYMTLVALGGIYELTKCVGIKTPAVLIPALAAAAFSVPICRYNFLATDGRPDGYKLLALLIFIDILFAVYMMTLCVFKPEKYDMEKNGYAAFMFIYILSSMQAAVLVSEKNALYVPLIFIAAWGTDAFAWLVGSLLGKHKLAPVVSPNKSVEGAVGGVAGCVLFCMIYALILGLIVKGIKINYIALIILAVITSVLSQFGDLLMSLLKRKYGVKDFSNLLPGHGGILDRFDSVIPVSLFLFTLYTVIDTFKVFIIYD